MENYYPILNNCSIRGDIDKLDSITKIVHKVFEKIKLPIEVNITNPILISYISAPPKQLRKKFHPKFCSLLHRNSTSSIHCDISDAYLKNKCFEENKKIITSCWAGNTEVLIPINHQNEVIGTIQFGQFLKKPPNSKDFNKINKITKKLGINSDELLKAYNNLPVIDDNQFTEIDYLINDIIKKISIEIDGIIEKDNSLINVIKSNKIFHNFIGRSDVIIKLKQLLMELRNSNCQILIRGESGTGKELIANIIHSFSNRRDNPFIVQNSASIPEVLIESELFGYKKGAFTDAKSDHSGLFELAHGGTLFLDEIGNMSINMQLKILRILEDGKIKPIGSNSYKNVDFRLITATNNNLEDGISDGLFRQDLYYRINTIEIYAPPLRERKKDIIMLSYHFLYVFTKKLNKKYNGFKPDVINLFLKYSWPGNIRELKNEVQRLVTCSISNDLISLKDISPRIKAEIEKRNKPLDKNNVVENQNITVNNNNNDDSIFDMVENQKKEKIINAIIEAEGNITKAASIIGCSRNTFYKKLKKYKLEKKN